MNLFDRPFFVHSIIDAKIPFSSSHLLFLVVVSDWIDAAQLADSPLKKLHVGEKEETLKSDNFDAGNFFGFCVGFDVFVDVS